MSFSKKPTLLNHGQVQKHLIAKTEKARSPTELFDQFGKYRDENISDYQKKKLQFLKACKQYNKLNQASLTSNNRRLCADYEELLDLAFLDEKTDNNEDKEVECSSMCCCEKCQPNLKGNLYRRRTTRPIHWREEEKTETCTQEQWFKRHLTLNKFIWAGRTTILKLRLLKRLEKLKTLTPDKIKEIEKERDVRKICELYHCDPVFSKFLQIKILFQ